MSLTVDLATPITRWKSAIIPTTGRRRRNAVTLIEILVVVAIIALLVAILLPALSQTREQVRSITCRSNMKQIANGMFFYIADYKVFPGTHSLFYMQNLFSTAWPRPTGVTWDGARDKLQGLVYTAAYTKPHHLDPEFIEDVPKKGTIFRYIKKEEVYTCPTDKPGEAQDTPVGGGGNGKLSYSMNAYIGYKAPTQLQSFRYFADSLNNPLPGGQKTRSFSAGQRIVFPAANYMVLFEEHPFYHINTSFPEGNFNGLDRIATRHMPTAGSASPATKGGTSIGFLDGHVENRIYPAKTQGRELFTEFGQPHFWHQAGPPDKANISIFIKKLNGSCPW